MTHPIRRAGRIQLLGIALSMMLAACATPTPNAPQYVPTKAPAPAQPSSSAPLPSPPNAAPAATSNTQPVPAAPSQKASEPTKAPEPTRAPAAASPNQPAPAASEQSKAPGAPAMPQPTAAPRPTALVAPTAAPNQPSQIAGNQANDRIPAEPTPAAPVQPPPLDNFFKDYGVNPFVDPNKDKLSTFALDVDTASYNIAKRYIQQGNLPPYQAVRVEEFVNAFKQGYAAPRDSAFGVFADGALSPFHNDGTYLVRIGVQGYQVPDFARKPASFIFVLDESGSMNDGNRIELARNTVRFLLGRLNPTDSVGIVAFTDDVRTVIDPTPANQRENIEQALNSVRPKGSTNVEAGMRRGYEMAARAYRPGGINRVILVSDGVANQGGLRPEQILQSVQEQAARGIQLTSVGVGFGNYNDTLMETLANKSEGGNYMYLNTNDDVTRLFVDRIITQQMIAKDAKVQVEFNNATVEAYRLLGYENRAVADVDFRNNAVSGGGIGAGHTSTAIYQLKLRPGAQGRLGTVFLRWQDPDSQKLNEINGSFGTGDLRARPEDNTPHYQLAISVAQFAEVLRRSAYRGEASMPDLSRRVNEIAAKLPGDAAVGEFAALVQRVAAMR